MHVPTHRSKLIKPKEVNRRYSLENWPGFVEEPFLKYHLFEFCIKCVFYFQNFKKAYSIYRRYLPSYKDSKLYFSYVGNQSETKMSDSIGIDI